MVAPDFPAEHAVPVRTYSAANDLTLQVVGGLHTGVQIPIDGAECHLGSSAKCDVVLADDDIASDHVRFRFYGRYMAIDAIGGDVQVAGHPDVVRGHGCRVTLPATVSVGGARVLIGRPSGALMRHPLRMATLTVCALTALVAVLSLTLRYGDYRAVASVNDISAPRPVAERPQPLQTNAASALTDQLQLHGLQTLRVTENGSHISISGELPHGGEAGWQETQRWFDQSFGGTYVLTSTVTSARPDQIPDFSFQAVWFGPKPYVVDAQGQRRYPGAALRDGWVLRAITPEAIILSRNGSDFKLTL